MPVLFYCPRCRDEEFERQVKHEVKRTAGRSFRYTSDNPGAPPATGSLRRKTVSLETSVRYAGDVAIVDLAGRIVLNDGSATMRETIAKLREGGANKILINLSAVSFMDSSGLGELASAYARINKAGGQLKLVNIPVRILDLLRITKLDSILTGFSDEPAALQSFGGAATA